MTPHQTNPKLPKAERVFSEIFGRMELLVAPEVLARGSSLFESSDFAIEDATVLMMIEP